MESRELAVRLANFRSDGHASDQEIRYWEERLNDSNNDYLFNAMNSITSYVKVSADLYGMETAYPIADLGTKLQDFLNDKVVAQLHECLGGDKEILRDQIEDSRGRKFILEKLEEAKENIDSYVLQNLTRTLENYETAHASKLFEDGVKDEEFLTKLANSAIEIAAKMQDGNKSIKFHNYAADIKKTGAQIGIAISQFYNDVKETFAKVDIDTEKKKAHIDFLKIPRALSAAAMSGREKIQSFEKTLKDSISKTFDIAKEAITSKFPKKYEIDFNKDFDGNSRTIPFEVDKEGTIRLDTYKVMGNIMGLHNADMLSRNEIVDLFERAQKSARKSGEKVDFRFAYGSTEGILENIVKTYGQVRFFFDTKTENGEEKGTMRIQIQDKKYGTFEADVPLTENESRQVFEKVSEKRMEIEDERRKEACEELSGYMEVGKTSAAESLIDVLDKAGYTFEPKGDDGYYKISNGDINGWVRDLSQLAQFVLDNIVVSGERRTIENIAYLDSEQAKSFYPIEGIVEPIIERNRTRQDVTQTCAEILENNGYCLIEDDKKDSFVLIRKVSENSLIGNNPVPNIIARDLKMLPDIMTAVAIDLEYDSHGSIDALTAMATEETMHNGYNEKAKALETISTNMHLFATSSPTAINAVRETMNVEANTERVKDEQKIIFNGREQL